MTLDTAPAATNPTLSASLADLDPEVHRAISAELHRQQSTLEMIASENYTSAAVMAGLTQRMVPSRSKKRATSLERLITAVSRASRSTTEASARSRSSTCRRTSRR